MQMILILLYIISIYGRSLNNEERYYSIGGGIFLSNFEQEYETIIKRKNITLVLILDPNQIELSTHLVGVEFHIFVHPESGNEESVFLDFLDRTLFLIQDSVSRNQGVLIKCKWISNNSSCFLLLTSYLIKSRLLDYRQAIKHINFVIGRSIRFSEYEESILLKFQEKSKKEEEIKRKEEIFDEEVKKMLAKRIQSFNSRKQSLNINQKRSYSFLIIVVTIIALSTLGLLSFLKSVVEIGKKWKYL